MQGFVLEVHQVVQNWGMLPCPISGKFNLDLRELRNQAMKTVEGIEGSKLEGQLIHYFERTGKLVTSTNSSAINYFGCMYTLHTPARI